MSLEELGYKYKPTKMLHNYLEILEQLKKRDENDFNRQVAPLKIADGAFIINNGNLTIEEGFQQALQIINSKK